MVPVAVLQVIISEIHDQQIILYGELGGQRSLHCVCGIFEAVALDRRLKKLTTPRPLTHEAWLTTAGQLGGKVLRGGINALREHTYFAFLHFEKGGEVVEMDVRPSDAIVLATLAEVPFYITKTVLDEVCGEPSASDGSHFSPSGERTGIQEDWR
jgi:bifunctional DNase/RNase